jgi:hypothetical protein
MQLLALTTYQARRWEPKRLRLSLFSLAGQLATTATPHPAPIRARTTGSTEPSTSSLPCAP